MTLRFDIDVDMDPSRLEVLGEKQLLDSLFENLLDNAIKYGPEESLILLHIGSNGSSTEVSVQDEGAGMNPQDFADLLNVRFKRIAGLIPGTGIGLPIANKIAQYHGARISYERPKDGGSIFKVTWAGSVIK